MRNWGRQSGYSMVSLMVGLVISMLTIAAMLAIYRTVVEVSGRASADSARDGQVASGLLAAQMELHNAGYKVLLPSLASGDVADTNEIQNLAIAVKSDDKRVVTWRFQVEPIRADGTTEVFDGCSQLRIEPQADGGLQMLYQAPEACTSTASASWTESAQVLVSYPKPWQDRAGSAIAEAASGSYLDMNPDATDSGFRIVNSSGQRCTLPYAQQDPALSATESPRIVLERAERELFSVCLSNIVAERKPVTSTPPTGGAGV